MKSENKRSGPELEKAKKLVNTSPLAMPEKCRAQFEGYRKALEEEGEQD